MSKHRTSSAAAAHARRRALGSIAAALVWTLCAAPRATAEPVVAAAHPAGWSDLSYYLPMRDGVRLAVSVWFPAGTVPATKVPVVLIQTRYGRAGVFNYGENKQYRRLLEAGYAVAVVDTRGTTSSFGSRIVEIGPDEVADMDVLIEHFRARPWSTGEVVATGVSYMADTADLAAGSASHLVATVVRESDFDAYLDLFHPGGVANDGMMNVWGGDTLLRDYGRSSNPKDGFDCALRVGDCAKLWPRLQPVDGDSEAVLLREALASRARHWQPDDYARTEYRDDKAANGFTFTESSPSAYLAAFGRERVPAQYWGSWMDAGTADAALSRYRALPRVPTEVWITAHTHGNDRLTDPFFPTASDPLPSIDQQWASMLGFVARARSHEAIERVIHYYVLGAHAYRTTTVWPPAGVQQQQFRFGPNGTLVTGGRIPADGEDLYAVDFTATTGEATRWSTQLGVPAAYPDRAVEDRKLLSYTSEPFAHDMELVGTPAVTLYVATKTSDPAFHAYLEDVAPDGRSTYLTEGLLRAVNRRAAAPAALPYPQAAPAKSYLRRDAAPMVPGAVAEVSFPTFPVAALIQAGHRLRISLAGADVSVFRRYSGGADESWRIERTTTRPSALTVGLRSWSKAL
jgi:uncharacterized protein